MAAVVTDEAPEKLIEFLSSWSSDLLDNYPLPEGPPELVEALASAVGQGAVSLVEQFEEIDLSMTPSTLAGYLLGAWSASNAAHGVVPVQGVPVRLLPLVFRSIAVKVTEILDRGFDDEWAEFRE